MTAAAVKRRCRRSAGPPALPVAPGATASDAQTLLVTAGRDPAVHAEAQRPQPSKIFTHRHCEGSEAIQCSGEVWIASSRSLSSGRALRADPLAPRNDEKEKEVDRRQTHCGQMRTAERTCTHAAHRARRGEGGLRRPSASGALACRRSTPALAGATERPRSAPVHALPGAGLLRAGCYPSPAAPVQRGFTPRRPVVMPAGRFGPEPPGNGADNPARGNRPRPCRPASPGWRPSGRECHRMYLWWGRLSIVQGPLFPRPEAAAKQANQVGFGRLGM